MNYHEFCEMLRETHDEEWQLTFVAIWKACYFRFMREMAEVTGIPYKTLQNWTADGPERRTPPDYTLTLLAYMLYRDGYLNHEAL